MWKTDSTNAIRTQATKTFITLAITVTEEHTRTATRRCVYHIYVYIVSGRIELNHRTLSRLLPFRLLFALVMEIHARIFVYICPHIFHV